MQFEIQKFADEEIKEYGDILDGSVEEKSQSDLPPIPKELAGVPEDIARDIMSKAAVKSETPAENPPTESENETSVPYKRFKETLDQKNEISQQLAVYRERYGDISAQTPQQNYQQQTPPPQTPPPQNYMPQFNSDVVKQIDDAITQRAMAISGLSKEDVESYV